MQDKKRFSLVEAIVKTLITGGLWLFFTLAMQAVPSYKRAWRLRATHILANADDSSSWPWIAASWLASIFGLIALEFWTIVYLSGITMLLPRAAFMTKTGHLTGIPLLFSVPVILAHIAWFGSLCILVAHTLWPSYLISAVKGRIAAWKLRPRGATSTTI